MEIIIKEYALFIFMFMLIVQAVIGIRLYKQLKDIFYIIYIFIPYSLPYYIMLLLYEYRAFRSFVVTRPNQKLNKMRSSESYKKLKQITGNPIGRYVPYCSYFKDGVIPSYENVNINKFADTESYISIQKYRPFSFQEFLSLSYIKNTVDYQHNRNSIILNIFIFISIVALIFFPFKYALASIIFLLGVVTSNIVHMGSPLFLGFVVSIVVLFIAYVFELIYVLATGTLI